jgi:D-alanyl-D-alanine-carboxypeptidase/D-alanyl-D-alanine-endopeptidase
VHLNQADDPATIIEKTGGGAGYTTYIALTPGRHIGIFVAATEGRHQGANIFRESNDLLTYLAGLTPVPGDSLELTADENHSDVQVREATLHKQAARQRLARQVARTSVLAAVQ